jgi:hypothetical protein
MRSLERGQGREVGEERLRTGYAESRVPDDPQLQGVLARPAAEEQRKIVEIVVTVAETAEE